MLAAGCGGKAQPKLAHADAAPLLALAARVADGGACGAIPELSRRTIALVNSHRVPAALQEPLLAGVNDLAAQPCRPGARAGAAARIETRTVGPVPHASGAAQQAGNLRAWLAAWSR